MAICNRSVDEQPAHVLLLLAYFPSGQRQLVPTMLMGATQVSHLFAVKTHVLQLFEHVWQVWIPESYIPVMHGQVSDVELYCLESVELQVKQLLLAKDVHVRQLQWQARLHWLLRKQEEGVLAKKGAGHTHSPDTRLLFFDALQVKHCF
jgi:hypothetical protein